MLDATQCQKMVKNGVFFSADGFNTHEFQAKRLCEDTNPWKKQDEMNIWTNRPLMDFNTLAAFRASSKKCHVNIAQGRNHGRNLVTGYVGIMAKTIIWIPIKQPGFHGKYEGFQTFT